MRQNMKIRSVTFVFIQMDQTLFLFMYR
jgi:hypothetical protein